MTKSHQSPPPHYDVIIIGAGPAGATCALQLRHSNLRVLLIDKATFPRSKTCGDAITGRSIKTLLRCCPELVEQFRFFPQKTEIKHTRLQAMVEEYIATLNASKKYKRPISVEVAAFTKFWVAEDYHQDYVQHHPESSYVQHESIPRLMRAQAQLSDILKPGKVQH